MNEEVLELIVLGRNQQAENIISLELGLPDGEPLPAAVAGAHIDFRLHSAGLIRQYSLAGNPADRTRYLLGVMLDPNTRGGSEAVHRDFVVGTKVSVSTPRNSFSLPDQAREVVLVGGGIGITPLLSMGHELSSRGIPFALHHCARSRSAAPFADVLQSPPFAGVTTSYFDDCEAAGRFDARTVLDEPNPDKHLMVCGPQGFMDHVIHVAQASGWHEQQIHLERFSLPERTGSGEGEREFTVRAERSGKAVRVRQNQSILDALLDAGVQVETSCEVGICGTCFYRVIEGVPDHRDEVLTPEEKASGSEIAVCCSRSLSETLILDI